VQDRGERQNSIGGSVGFQTFPIRFHRPY
jgi:hypothetical protein